MKQGGSNAGDWIVSSLGENYKPTDTIIHRIEDIIDTDKLGSFFIMKIIGRSGKDDNSPLEAILLGANINSNMQCFYSHCTNVTKFCLVSSITDEVIENNSHYYVFVDSYISSIAFRYSYDTRNMEYSIYYKSIA